MHTHTNSVKQEFQHSTQLRLFDDHRLSNDYYVVFAGYSKKLSVDMQQKAKLSLG